jgi:hypothetical protein
MRMQLNKRHCEEPCRGDEAIQEPQPLRLLLWIASLRSQ